jgi:hypothetical protein
MNHSNSHIQDLENFCVDSRKLSLTNFNFVYNSCFFAQNTNVGDYAFYLEENSNATVLMVVSLTVM